MQRFQARGRWIGLAGLLLGLACVVAIAQQAIPRLEARVTDLTGTLQAEQREALDAELAALERDTGAQVAVLMVGSTAPDDIAAYAMRVFDQWRLGRAGIDDGVLLLVARDDRRVRIEVARGLEGAIPDAAAARIIREYIAPRFRANDWYGGIHEAVDALALLVRDEPLPPPLDDGPVAHEGEGIAGALVAAWFVAVFLRRLTARQRALPRAVVTGGGAGGVAWLLSGLAVVGVGATLLGGLLGLLGGGSGGFVRRTGSGPLGGPWGTGAGLPRSFPAGRGGGGFRGGGGMSAGGGASGGW